MDYWNYLGWNDRFSNKEYSQRQRGLVRQGLVSQVYTPGFVVNSAEWRGWFKGSRRWQPSNSKPGILKAKLDGDHLQVDFQQKQVNVLYVAVLGFGLTTDVKSGENSGRVLKHDFVVLNMVSAEGNGTWDIPIPVIPQKGQQKTGLAVWVSPRNSYRVIQATGGYL